MVMIYLRQMIFYFLSFKVSNYFFGKWRFIPIIYRLPTHFAAAGGQDAILPYLEDNCADFKAFDSISNQFF